MTGADEQPLGGGNLSAGVVRVGDTVRRPTGPWTPAVHALLQHLEHAGFVGAPRVLGFDDRGREILEYIDGEVPWPDDSRLDDLRLVRRIGATLRAFHVAVADFVPAPDAVWRYPAMQADAVAALGDENVIVCHNDAAAWNVVVSEHRLAFIDWDVAGPRPALWDVAYSAVALLHRDAPVADRLRALVDGYEVDVADRKRFPDLLVARITSSYEHMRRRAAAGEAPWDRLWAEGHGAAWAELRDFAVHLSGTLTL